jgi:putative transposase
MLANRQMNKSNMYKRYRFPSEIIQSAVWLYYRFNLSHRDIEDLLAERGIFVTYESIRLWCNKFGSKYAARLRSYGVAHRELIPEVIHDTSQYANNRAELSHQPTRVRERGMRKFKSMRQAQRFLNAHAAVYNLINLGRHLISAKTYRFFRLRAFASWKNAVDF